MTSIYLIRHAEAEGNLYRIAQGHEDGKLTKRGWEQVRALSRRFEDIHIDAVYSSDLYRTCATASAIYLPKGLVLNKDRDLREVNLGEWERKPWGEIARENPEQLIWFSTQCHLWRVRGGETAEEAQTRLYKTIRKIAKRHDGETIAITSHGFAIRMLLGKLQGYPLERIGESPQEDNTAVSLLEFDGNDLKVVFRSDNSHLLNLSGAGKIIARKRASALEDGMYYQPFSFPIQTESFQSMSTAAWREAGEDSTGDGALIEVEAPYTLFGFNGKNYPSALLQMSDVGNIRLLYVRPEERQQGLGVQLIGQAAQWTLSQGGDHLYISLRTDNPAIKLFEENDFVPVSEIFNGKIFLKKNLRNDLDF